MTAPTTADQPTPDDRADPDDGTVAGDDGTVAGDDGTTTPGAGPQALCPRVRLVWQARSLAVAVGAVALGIAAAILTDGTPRLLLVALASAFTVGGLLEALVFVPRRYRRWSYTLGSAALELHHGVVTHHASTVPYVRVQHIDLTAGPLDRRLDLTTLVIRTASATTDAHLPGIDGQAAERLRRTILRRAGLDDAV